MHTELVEYCQLLHWYQHHYQSSSATIQAFERQYIQTRHQLSLKFRLVANMKEGILILCALLCMHVAYGYPADFQDVDAGWSCMPKYLYQLIANINYFPF